MTDTEPTGKKESPREVYDRVQKWVEDKQFGTPEYQAVSDYLDLRRLKIELDDSLVNSLSAKDDRTKVKGASNVRIKEGEIALLKDHIRERSAQQKGYEDAYVRIESQLQDEIGDAVHRDAAAEYPDDKKTQDALADTILDDFIYEVQDVLYRKRQ